jgi:hypothetical protein
MRKGFWIIGFCMTVFFFSVAFFLLFSDLLIDKIPASKRDYLALVFFAYSGFRSFRLYKQYPFVFRNANEQ